MAYKSGRLSPIEREYIRDNANDMTYVEIAEKLNRRPLTIKRYIEKELGVAATLSERGRKVSRKLLKPSLRNKEIWASLKEQFTEKELRAFESYWNSILEQFDNDVLPTEELQIIDVIKLTVMMDRNLRQQKMTIENLSQLEQLRESEEDPTRIVELDSQIAALQAAISSMTREYRDMQQRKDQIFTSLKATRAQRIKQIDSSKETITTWLNRLMSDAELREELSAYLESVRLATIDEEVRLSAYHKYEDGMIDQPLLTPETVKQDQR